MNRVEVPPTVDRPEKFGKSTQSESLVSLPLAERQSPIWLVWDNRASVMRLAMRAMLLLTLVVIFIPNRYEATTRVVPPDNSGNAAMLAGLAARNLGAIGPLAGDLLGNKNQGAYYISILRSRTVLDRLIERFQLQKVYWDRYMETARRDLVKFTSVDEDRKSGVITIRVRDRSRQRARDIANGYVEELNRVAAELNMSAAHRERVFIEQRLATVKNELDTSSRQFSEYASKNTAIDIKEQSRAMVEAAALLQGQLIAAQSELQGLEQIYTENNVRVRSLKSRITELERQLQKLGGTESDLATTAPSKDIYPSIRKLPLLGVQWADLYRRVKMQETVFELLTQQYELAKVQEAKELPTVRVLDPADIPERKSSPKRMLILAMGAIMSLVVSSAFILVKEYWNQLDPADERKAFLNEVSSTIGTATRRLRLKARARKIPPTWGDTP